MVNEPPKSLVEELNDLARDPEKYLDQAVKDYLETKADQRRKVDALYSEVLGIDRAKIRQDANDLGKNVISLDEARKRKRAQHFQFTQAYSDNWTQRAVGGARRGALEEEDMGWFVDPKSFRCVVPDEDLYGIIVKGFGEDVLASLHENNAETFLSKLIFFFDGVPIEPYNVKLDPKGQRFLIEFFLFEDDQKTFELDRFESNIEDNGLIRIQLWTR
jgi:hypothetical protein